MTILSVYSAILNSIEEYIKTYHYRKSATTLIPNTDKFLLCTEFELVICNSIFQPKEIHKF